MCNQQRTDALLHAISVVQTVPPKKGIGLPIVGGGFYVVLKLSRTHNDIYNSEVAYASDFNTSHIKIFHAFKIARYVRHEFNVKLFFYFPTSVK